jgi:Tripartite tricarboxylate transporter family receptor
MVIENRPGAASLIGTEAVSRAAPDGDTLLMMANSFVIQPHLRKLNYQPLTSFEPVCYLVLSLPKTRFERIDGGARQGSDMRQHLRTARPVVCRAHPSQAKREFASDYNRQHISQEIRPRCSALSTIR